MSLYTFSMPMYKHIMRVKESNMKKALITGIRGQDGAYLSQLLLEKGYHVIGADRRSGGASHWRLERLGIKDAIEFVHMDMLEFHNICDVIKKHQPDEIYNLAAQSFVHYSFKAPFITHNTNALGVLRLLEAVRCYSPYSKVYQASTSEMFGGTSISPQNETTPFFPESPYGISKLSAHWYVVNYRRSYNMFACSGILFNHESPLRGEEFVTRKITRSVTDYIFLDKYPILLGNMEAKRDWGFAGDYVKAMWMMLQSATPDDYVIATGESHSIKEFVEEAFSFHDIDITWAGEGKNTIGCTIDGKVVVKVNEEFYRPVDVNSLLGNYKKAKLNLGWNPTVTFKGLVYNMMYAESPILTGEHNDTKP